MMDVDRLKNALVKAHEAGDTEAATLIAEEIRKAQSSASSGPPRRYSAKRQPEPGFLSQMVSNIPGSAAQYGKDIYQAVRHPIDTISGLGAIGAGAIQSLIPGEQGYEPAARQAGKFYADRYGGREEILNTIKTDPVGALADVSGVLTGASAAAPKTLGAVGKVGAALDPVNIAIKPAQAVGKAIIPKSLPEGLMMSSAKFGTTYSPAERRAMGRTMLDNDFVPNMESYDRLTGMMDDLGKQIDQVIDTAAAQGGTVPISALTKEIPELLRRNAGPTLSSAKNTEIIRKVISDYADEMAQRGITRLSVKDLQDFKTDAYKQINWSKMNVPGDLPPAKEDAMARMARSARQEIEQAAPDIATLNRQYGELAQLREPLSRSINRIDNRDLIGIGIPLKSGAGAVMGQGAGALAGWGLGFLDAPLPKAYTARWLEHLRTSPVYSDRTKYAALMRQLAAESGGLSGL